MTDILTRLRKPIPGYYTGNIPLESEWCVSMAAVEGQRREAADLIERLRHQVRLLHDATIILRNGIGGHNHWDSTGQCGSGCQICIAQREARDNADKLIDAAASKSTGQLTGRESNGKVGTEP